MPIAIEGYSVVGLKCRIEENFSGGIQALSEIVPNSTELVDDDLWRCSFMVSTDAERFLLRLQEAGLNSTQGPDSDVVVVSEFDLSVAPYCEWLEVVTWEKGVIARRQGSSSQKLIAREGWTPERGSGLSFVPTVEGNLEFLRMDGNVHVYFDKERGREVYVGRVDPDPDEVYKVASAAIFKFGFDSGESPLSDEAKTKIRDAIVDLEKLAQHHPDNWRIHFCLGKGKQALCEFDAAYESFHRAYALEQETEVVLRELVCVCLDLGKGDEAMRVGQKAASLQPDNSETLGNLACAYLFNARLPEARSTIEAALKLKPQDSINLTLDTIIKEVQAGQRLQPRRMSDLMPPNLKSGTDAEPAKQTKSKSRWNWLMFWKRH